MWYTANNGTGNKVYDYSLWALYEKVEYYR